MNVLLLASHAVAEYDDLRMFTDMGFDCFAPGGYEVPSRSGEGIRPALPDAPHHPEFVELCNKVRAEKGEPGPAIDWAKAHIPDEIIDWADVIICHHFPERWIGQQWDRIKHKRVIWRTCGQSNPDLEQYMGGFPDLQIVRYSPAERRYFERLGIFAGEDALIRFGKYPDDYEPWIGDWPVVINITQHMKQRGDACGYGFWEAATQGLPRMPLGPGSDEIGGLGELTYDEMKSHLQHSRAYLYTGTRPASYTLGLMEAMLAGIPVVSIGPDAWGEGWGGERLFEGHEVALQTIGNGWSYPFPASAAQDTLAYLLHDEDMALEFSIEQRLRAIELFDVDVIGAQWARFLS